MSLTQFYPPYLPGDIRLDIFRHIKNRRLIYGTVLTSLLLHNEEMAELDLRHAVNVKDPELIQLGRAGIPCVTSMDLSHCSYVSDGALKVLLGSASSALVSLKLVSIDLQGESFVHTAANLTGLWMCSLTLTLTLTLTPT